MRSLYSFPDDFMGILSRGIWRVSASFSMLIMSLGGTYAQSKSITDDEFKNIVTPFLNEHCLNCHSGTNAHVDFRIDNLSRELRTNLDSWREVIDRIRSDEMPPKDVLPQPGKEQRKVVADWLDDEIRKLEALRLAKRNLVSLNRMSRLEYANTIEDLLGVRFHVDDAGRMNEDEKWRGIQRIGSALTVSASHVEKYLTAAKEIVDEAYPVQKINKIDETTGALALAGGAATFGEKRFRELMKNGSMARLDLWPGQSVQLITDKTWDAGVYRFRVQTSGLRSGNARPPHFAIYAQEIDRLLFEKDVVAAENKPLEICFDVHLPAGNHEFELVNEVVGPHIFTRFGKTAKPFYGIKEGYLPWQYELVNSRGIPNYPCLIVDWIKIEGPIVSNNAIEKRDRFWPNDENNRQQIRECLTRFATHAFRRPVTRSEIDRYSKFAFREIKLGKTPRSAIKAAMQAVLVSKDFLYLIEGNANIQTHLLDDLELASRLSYFLWSSMPDGELIELACNSQLHRSEVLKKQVTRMLADPRSSRLSEDFSRQWLQLDRVGKFKPDANLYPSYDKYLERSMTQETVRYFAHVLEHNLTLREFLVSDWTMLNPRLADHYKIDLIEAADLDEIRRVNLKPAHHRGGILTHASILSLTSDGTRHRPVHRGVWIAESIYGQRIPSPPANVEPIKPNPTDFAKLSLRTRLESHVKNTNCSICHLKIDPPGFAYENYNAIGQWRTKENVPTGDGANPSVDASGKLHDGRLFEDATEFQQLLLDDIGNFNKVFVNRLTTYALRRALSVKDKPALDAIEKNTKSKDYRLRDLVETIVLSDLFRQR